MNPFSTRVLWQGYCTYSNRMPHAKTTVLDRGSFDLALSLSPDSLQTKSRLSFVVHEGYYLHSGPLGTTALSPTAGPWDYDRDSVASPTMAVRGPFSSYPHDDRGQGPRYDTIDNIHRRSKLYYLFNYNATSN